MRDVESLCEQAMFGKLSKSTASRICEELRERFEAFKRRSLYDTRLVALFLDARPSPCVGADPRRASWWPGDSPKTASVCCFR